MFSDPLSLTIAGVAKSLVRIVVGNLQATYKTNDGAYIQKISHQESKDKIRSMVRTDYNAAVTDPVSGLSSVKRLSVYTVIERPMGFSETQVANLLTGHQDQFDSTFIAKLYGEES